MTVLIGTCRTACRGPTWLLADVLQWPHHGLPRRSMMAGAPRRSRSYVLASLRALHLDLRLVACKTGASRGSRNCRTARPAAGEWGQAEADIEDVRFAAGPPLAVIVGPTQDALTNEAAVAEWRGVILSEQGRNTEAQAIR